MHWFLRKSTDAGLSWTNVAGLPPGRGLLFGLAADKAGNLYAVGEATVGTDTAFHWIVRKSVDGGANWSTLDDFQYAPGYGSGANGLAFGRSGSLYAVGKGYVDNSPGGSHWVVRQSADQGSTWSTVDDFVGDSMYSTVAAGAWAVASDTTGNIYVGGHGYSNLGYSVAHWVVRQLAAPTRPLPALKLIRSGGTLLLSWPASVNGAVLEMTDSLSATATWASAPTASVAIGDQTTVTANLTGPARFYRLRKP